MSKSISKFNECLLCNSNSKDTPNLLPYIDSTWDGVCLFSSQSIAYCRACGFGYCKPGFKNDDLSMFYTNIYRQKGTPFYIDFNSLSKPASYDYRSLSQLILAKHFVDFKKGDVFLDIGPGNGTSYSSAQYVFSQPALYGIEMSSGAATAYKNAYGAKTFSNTTEFFTSDIKPKVVLSSHSLEHFSFESAVELLVQMRSALLRDGILVIEVPHVDMRIHQEMRKSDSPHLLFFSKNSLYHILNQSGYDVLFIDSCCEDYMTWWNRMLSTTKENISFRKLIAHHPAISYYAKCCYRVLIHDRLNFDNINFEYGGNRTCLRAVARSKYFEQT